MASEIVETTVPHSYLTMFSESSWWFFFALSVDIKNYKIVAMFRDFPPTITVCSFSVFRLNFMLICVCVFQETATFLASLISSIWAKLKLFFVTFKPNSDGKWSSISRSHTAAVFTIKPVYVFAHSMVPYVFISSPHLNENFSCFFLDKYGIYAVCFVKMFNVYEMCIIQKLPLA